MVKKRLIVTLLYRDGVIVQSINFKHTNVVGSMKIAIEFFNMWEADEIIILNVSRKENSTKRFLRDVEDVAKKSFLPLSIGGYVKNIDDAKLLFDIGADKIVINTEMFERPEIVTEIMQHFGSQAVVASIDVKKIDDDHIVFVDRGRVNTGIEVSEYAKSVESLGAGEVFLTSIDKDGSKEGYDIELMSKVSNSIKIPVIAFGGIQDFNDMVKCLNHTNVAAVAAGNPFHYTEQSTRKAKRILLDAGIDTRIPSNFFNY